MLDEMLDLEEVFTTEIDASEEAFEQQVQEELDAIILAEAWAYM